MCVCLRLFLYVCLFFFVVQVLMESFVFVEMEKSPKHGKTSQVHLLTLLCVMVASGMLLDVCL